MEMRPFICSYDDCEKSFTTQSHLKRHEDSHEKSVKCTQENCKQTFKNSWNLKKHIDIVHEKKKPKKYKCSECGEEFNKHNWLTSHQYKHTGVKPYVCPKKGCDKSFLLPSRLKRHMKIHEGYACTVENCKEVSATWTLHRKHLKLSHPTIYRCQYCEKAFFRSNNLKAHMKFHESEREAFPCPKPNCSRVYTSQHILNDHVKSYHNKRPFVCPIEHCCKTFKTEDDLTAHHSRHFRRTRRKKKKGNPRPSFATKLAGLAPKKWQTKLLSGDKIESDEEASEDSLSEMETSLESTELNDNSKEECSILNSLEEPEEDSFMEITVKVSLEEPEVYISEQTNLEQPEVHISKDICEQTNLEEPEIHISEQTNLEEPEIYISKDISEQTNLEEPEIHISKDIFHPDLLALTVDENVSSEYKDTKMLQVIIHRDNITESAVKNVISVQNSQILMDTSCYFTEASDVQLFCEILCNDGKIRHFPDLLPFNPNFKLVKVNKCGLKSKSLERNEDIRRTDNSNTEKEER